MASGGRHESLPDWAQDIMLAREFHVLPSQLRAMSARDYACLVEFVNAENRKKGDDERKRAVEKSRQDRRGRR